MKSYNENKDKVKSFKGITLIALVITIIILLILAGVTINEIRNNGLFSKVINSKEETLKSQSLEELKLKVSEIQVERIGQASLKDIAISLKNDTENKYIVSVDSDSNENSEDEQFENINKIYVNEVNTIPGSLSFHLWRATDVNYKDLLDKMIDLALKRNREEGEMPFSFDSNILAGYTKDSFKGFGGTKGAKLGK